MTVDPMERSYAQAEIVLVEPEPVSAESVMRVLERAGYPRLIQITGPEQMRRYVQTADPDLLVVDVDGPAFDGPGLVAEVIARVAPERFLPILALGSPDPAVGRRSLSAGAKDYVTKPVDPEELRLRVHSLLDTRFVYVRLREARNIMEGLVRRRSSEVRQAQQETLELLSRVAELRDDATGEHTKRVGRLSGMIAEELGLGRDQVWLISNAAPLHDLGKIAVTDKVLLKEGSLDTNEERAAMRHHAVLGAELLSGAQSDVLRMAREIAASHHEHWDGRGYPRGLRGEEIPLAARIVALADVFDALLHTRPYKPAWSAPAALAEIRQERALQFDPRVVDALFRIDRLVERVLSNLA